MGGGGCRLLKAIMNIRCGTILFLLLCSYLHAQNECQFIRWEQSYKAGNNDINGNYLGGSQMMHLVPHKGKLYAGLSYWMDRGCAWYGKQNHRDRWAQILRLDSPNASWVLDFQLPETFLRPEILRKLTFRTDGEGNRLREPFSFLITCTSYRMRHNVVGVKCFARDDATGKWNGSFIYTGSGTPGEGYSIRDMHVHRDKVTGVDMVFTTIGTFGIFSGVLDKSVPGWIRWNEKCENKMKIHIRPLSIVEANGSLHFSTGRRVFRRIDGPNPSYVKVHDLSDYYSDEITPPVGGIRGMTSIKNPKGRGDSLIFVWSPKGGAFTNPGEIFRLDPDGPNNYTRTKEVVLGELLGKYLKAHVFFILGAYNDFMPVKVGKKTEHIIGFESVIHRRPYVPYFGSNVKASPDIGYYRGGAFAIRSADGKYRIEEIKGKYGTKQHEPPLAATVAYAISPFKDENAIYFSGLDPNHVDATNHSWIFKGILKGKKSLQRSRSAAFSREKVNNCPELYREWTNKKGQTVVAKLIANYGSKVYLQKRSGEKITIKTNSLSSRDRSYLKSIR